MAAMADEVGEEWTCWHATGIPIGEERLVFFIGILQIVREA